MPIPLRRLRLRRPLYLALLSAAVAWGCSSAAPEAAPAPSGFAQWPAYGGDAGGSRWSPLTEINRDNVAALEPAWTFHTGETEASESSGAPRAFEATPIVVDGALYLSTPLGKVFALDPQTGRQRWRFDAKVDPELEFGDFGNRGVSTWFDSTAAPDAPCRRRIFLATIDARLFALDARDGRLCGDFGERGLVDLRRGLRNPPAWTEEYEMTSPPAVLRDRLVVGSAVADNNRADAASGEVRAFDIRTGELLWTWDPVPQDSLDPAWDTWSGAAAHRTGAANAWSVIAADPERDLVFVPTGSASPDHYGGERLGANLYANSVVALRGETGEVVWHFQVVHHDLWDYDVAAPPALVTLRRGGREVPVVLVATKTAQLFVLHRDTGEPVFPVEERPVPASDVPGEEAWPTQPFSSLPPLSPQRMDPEDAWGITPLDRRQCRQKLGRLRNEGIFTPPSVRGSFVLPHHVGGAHWGGVAYDPSRAIVVVPVNTVAAYIRLIPRDRGDAGEDSEDEFARMQGTPFQMRRGVLTSRVPKLPCTPPPFGALVAISLESERKLWEVPLGTTRDLFARQMKVPISRNWGTPNLGGAIATAGGLVFIGAAMDDYIRAFDIETGRELWKGRLPAGGQATPMTYRIEPDGRQYVVIAAGGHGRLGTNLGDAVVAFALPGAGDRDERTDETTPAAVTWSTAD